MTAPCTTPDGPHVGYQRRRPERSVLYQIVSQHIETLWAEAEASSPDAVGYPAYVKHEFERFLSCGQLPGGFTRLRCRGCGCERHADLSVHAADRAGLQRALRYGLRPPLSQKRLSLTPAGKVRLALRKPLSTGQTYLAFEPVSFLRRLAACIPRPRQNMLRFHGLFAPNAAARGALTALVPKPKALTLPTLPLSSPPATDPTQDPPPADTPTPVPAVYRRPWAELLKRVLDQDALRCPRCHQRMVPIQTVKDPVVIRKILSHLGLPAELPTAAAARTSTSTLLPN